MSRLSAIDLAAADPKAKPLLAAVQASLGATPNMFRVAAHAPAALQGLLTLNGALAKGRLRTRVREAIALAVAEANGCDYCLAAHSALGAKAGLAASDIEDARQASSTDPKTAALLAFTAELVRGRGRVGGATLDTLRGSGVSDEEIVETIANTVANVFTNYLNLVADTEIDFPAVRPVATRAA